MDGEWGGNREEETVDTGVGRYRTGINQLKNKMWVPETARWGG